MARCSNGKALQTRDRIIDAAEDVFHAKGVSSTSLADVADVANVTRGAIYWHFKNKADLFDAMCQRIRLPMPTLCATMSEEAASDPLGELRATCRFLFRETMNNPHYNKVLDILIHKCEFVDSFDSILIRQEERMRQWDSKNKLLLSNAITTGQLPATLDLRLASIMLHSMTRGLLTNWLFAPDSFDLVQEGEKIIEAYIETLLVTCTLRVAAGELHVRSTHTCA